ncbi:hypothetical protein GY45DRAFT_770412 [Cubamyces sp. BRFM 1775]|nr:hypothetical protein GY45DRAFT_770412 [Cubamyces sp. BRFM 1775]
MAACGSHTTAKLMHCTMMFMYLVACRGVRDPPRAIVVRPTGKTMPLCCCHAATPTRGCSNLTNSRRGPRRLAQHALLRRNLLAHRALTPCIDPDGSASGHGPSSHYTVREAGQFA